MGKTQCLVVTHNKRTMEKVRIEFARRGRTVPDEWKAKVDENGRTSESWLWSAGDMVNGPDVIHAVAEAAFAAALWNPFVGKTVI